MHATGAWDVASQEDSSVNRDTVELVTLAEELMKSYSRLAAKAPPRVQAPSRKL